MLATKKLAPPLVAILFMTAGCTRTEVKEAVTPLPQTIGETAEAITQQIEGELVHQLKASGGEGSLDPRVMLGILRHSVPDDTIDVTSTVEPGPNETLVITSTITNRSDRFEIFQSVYAIDIKDCVGDRCTTIAQTALRLDGRLPLGTPMPVQATIEAPGLRANGKLKAETKVAANWSTIDQAVVDAEVAATEAEENAP